MKKGKISGQQIGWSLLILAGLAILIGVGFSPNAASAAAKKSFTIGLAVLKDNPDYQTGRMAFVNIFDKQADITTEFKLLDAYGDLDVYKKGLASLVKEDKVDLIFTTGTRSTEPAVEIIKDVPIVFTAVADPVKSGLVKSLAHPGGNVTGTHCAVPASAQLKVIMRVFPQAKRIGIVYTKGESNAEIQTRDFEKAAKELGLKILTATVPLDCKTEEEVSAATTKLVGKVDVLVAHQDTTLSRYGRGMIAVAEENNIPTYVSLGQLLSVGAVFSLGIDFKALGDISGEQALKILKENVKPSDIPVDTDKHYSLIINLSAAKRIGATIPVEVLRTASKIIK